MRSSLFISGISIALAVAVSTVQADDGKLRLNFDTASAATIDANSTGPTLDEMLSLSPRIDGLNLSAKASDTGSASGGALGVGYGDRALGLDYQLFTSFNGSGSDRFGVSGLTSSGLGRGLSLNDNLSLAPDTGDEGNFWHIGGRVGYAGFTFGADFARETGFSDQAEYRDYRLDVSYRSDNWKVGMQYVRSLQSGSNALLGVADALEFGGVYEVNGSVDLVGGIQFWDQEELSTVDAQSRDALIFFGTRIQF